MINTLNENQFHDARPYGMVERTSKKATPIARLEEGRAKGQGQEQLKSQLTPLLSLKECMPSHQQECRNIQIEGERALKS
jgi:hypothetical protein